jgi:4-amino-4-deoxy-L-arabinose transferase-like glycosyltransferase
MSDSPPRTERSRAVRAALLAVLLVAAALRIGAVFSIGDIRKAHGDEGYYVAAARRLVDGEGYRGSVRPPGQPAFIASVMLVFGKGLTAVRYAQVLVSLAAIVFVYALARRRFGVGPGLVSAFLCAIQPELIHYTHFLWAETLVVTQLLGLIWALDTFDVTKKQRWLLLAGAILGVTVLTREVLVYFVPVVLGWVWIGHHSSVRSTVRHTALIVIPLVAIVTPWTMRNYFVHGDFVLVSTTRWLPLAQGNALPAHGSTLDLGWGRDISRRYEALPDELTREAFARELALESIRAEQPTWIVRKLQRNAYHLFAPMTQLARFAERGWFGKEAQPLVERLVPIEACLYVALTLLGIVAIWIVPDGGNRKLLIAGLILLHLAIYTVANANHRFRLPLQPFLLLYAGPLLLGHATTASRLGWRQAGAGVCAAAFVLIVGVHAHREGSIGATPKPPPHIGGVPASLRMQDGGE